MARDLSVLSVGFSHRYYRTQYQNLVEPWPRSLDFAFAREQACSSAAGQGRGNEGCAPPPGVQLCLWVWPVQLGSPLAIHGMAHSAVLSVQGQLTRQCGAVLTVKSSIATVVTQHPTVRCTVSTAPLLD